MTQEEKQLLLQDLCGRLPYGVKTIYQDIIMEVFVVSNFFDNMCCLKWDSHKGYYNQTHAHIGQFKPYLRPMSSMTEEEKEEYCNLQDIFLCSSQYPITDAYELFHWLNEHHFDYRGLIEKGLAIEAPDGMYMSYSEKHLATEDIIKKRDESIRKYGHFFKKKDE